MNRPAVILVDALGTIVRLDDPFGALHAELSRRGAAISPQAVADALSEEMRFYRAHCIEAADAAALDALRDRCAGVLARELGSAVEARVGGRAELRVALLSALGFSALPDALPALRRWRTAGSRVAVVSNWDVSLHEVLRRTGLRDEIDAVVTSAEVGAAKPDPVPFRAALDRLGADPADAIHVGDTLAEDVTGARAAGVRAVLLARERTPRDAAVPLPRYRGVPVVRSLGELWP